MTASNVHRCIGNQINWWNNEKLSRDSFPTVTKNSGKPFSHAVSTVWVQIYDVFVTSCTWFIFSQNYVISIFR